MSARKKKIISACPGCNSFILTKDSDKHKPHCGEAFESSNIPLICPNNGFVGTSATLEKRESYLPPDFFGWSKFENVLMHPDTISTLNILPRSAVLISINDVENVYVVWPCDQMPQIRVSISGIPGEKRAVVRIVNAPKTLKKIQFLPDSMNNNVKLPSTEIFVPYLQVYFSNAYVIQGGTVTVKYYGQTYQFSVPGAAGSIENDMSNLSMESIEYQKADVVKLSSNVAILLNGAANIQKHDDIFSGIKKRTGFDRIGGLSKAKSELSRFVIDPINKKTEACSAIIWGLTGAGKSLFLTALSEILPNCSFVTPASLSKLPATERQSTVLLVDNFEVKAEKNSDASVDALCRIIDEKQYKSVIVVVRSIETLDLRLRRRFPVEIELMVPDPIERLDILKIVLENEQITADEIQELARNTHGFTGADLAALAMVASHCSEENPIAEIHVDRFTAARRRIRPTGIRQFVLEVPDVKWEDIGGEEELKKEIEQAVIWPFKHPEAFERLGVEPPSGILLYGPPGCSKTLIARALAAQSKLNFLSVKGPELFSKWVGESERAVRELFHRARQVAPAVLFFDEIDAVATKRGGDSSSGVTDRVLAQLLTELDGLEKSTGLIVLAATNRPETLDSAILRPGRLDRSLYVPLPDYSTRKSILRLQLKKMACMPGLDVEKLAEKTTGYSGAEIVALCKNAGFLAMRQNLDSTEIHSTHFEEALSIIVPRTDKKTILAYEQFSKGIQM